MFGLEMNMCLVLCCIGFKMVENEHDLNAFVFVGDG